MGAPLITEAVACRYLDGVEPGGGVRESDQELGVAEVNPLRGGMSVCGFLQGTQPRRVGSFAEAAQRESADPVLAWDASSHPGNSGTPRSTLAGAPILSAGLFPFVRRSGGLRCRHVVPLEGRYQSRKRKPHGEQYRGDRSTKQTPA